MFEEIIDSNESWLTSIRRKGKMIEEKGNEYERWKD